MSGVNEEYMSSAEVARLAQVARPVVTTWRRRHQDFPVPVPNGGGQLLYSANSVLNWLLATGLGNTEPETLRAERDMNTLTAYARKHGGRRMLLSLSAALALRHLAGRALPADLLSFAHRLDPDDEFLLSDLREAAVPAVLPQLVEQLIEGAYDPSRAHQFLLGNAARLGWPELNAHALTASLITLIRMIADLPGRLHPAGHLTIGDPWAGPGDLLAALLPGQEPETLRFTAAQPDLTLARLIRRRLLLSGVPEFAVDVVPDELNDEFAEADVIVTRLPYQPAELRDTVEDLSKIGDIADRLGPGRTAIVVGPAAGLVDTLRDTDAIAKRAELLTQGFVEAVVRLPGGVFPARPGHPAALWVLTRDPIRATEGRVFLADLSSADLDERGARTVAEDILLWRAEGFRPGDGHESRTGQVVPLTALDLRRGTALRPSASGSAIVRARQAADRPALIGEAERRLTEAEQEAISYGVKHGPLTTRAAQRDGARPKAIFLGALRAARRVRQLPGHRLSPSHVTPRGHYRVLGPAEVLAPSSKRWIDRLILNTEYPHALLTEPGDIVVTSAPRFGALLDESGLSVIEFPARGLRVVPGSGLTPRVLKALLDIADNTTRSPSAVRPQRLHDVTIPDLSGDEVARLDDVLRRLDERERLLRQQSDLLTELRGLAVTGFADGTLTTLYGTDS
ncbi:N-6 DNA methylase [Paractinoplanes brasiliensis]|uniref:N-6 DNA methylase n=1 Tax=Paractinoplanes brasiliensis TaxID=52695 RepID=A0A4R6JQ47_9ACTN|nr:N-6 DNA methylase [Actinoplanes brasiliensis]GID26636.1 type II restriction endonuclease subunit M [Actinoplanes brasiliensis]